MVADAGDVLVDTEGHGRAGPSAAPAATPATTAATRPTHGDPLWSVTRNPTNAPAYIVPSMPRLRTPARSVTTSPVAP